MTLKLYRVLIDNCYWNIGFSNIWNIIFFDTYLPFMLFSWFFCFFILLSLLMDIIILLSLYSDVYSILNKKTIFSRNDAVEWSVLNLFLMTVNCVLHQILKQLILHTMCSTQFYCNLTVLCMVLIIEIWHLFFDHFCRKLCLFYYHVRLIACSVCSHPLKTWHNFTRNNPEESNRMVLAANSQGHFHRWITHQIHYSTYSLLLELCGMWHHLAEITCQPSSTWPMEAKKVEYHDLISFAVDNNLSSTVVSGEKWTDDPTSP